MYNKMYVSQKYRFYCNLLSDSEKTQAIIMVSYFVKTGFKMIATFDMGLTVSSTQ